MVSSMMNKIINSYLPFYDNIIYCNLVYVAIQMSTFTISDVWTGSVFKQPVNTFSSTMLCSLGLKKLHMYYQ